MASLLSSLPEPHPPENIDGVSAALALLIEPKNTDASTAGPAFVVLACGELVLATVASLPLWDAWDEDARRDAINAAIDNEGRAMVAELRRVGRIA